MSSFTPNGLIVAHHGISVEVLFDNGSRRMVRVKRNSGHVVGDSVVVTGDVLKRQVRCTELQRRDARGGIHLVAANLDVLGIVVALQSPSGFLDRAIVAARSAGLRPFVVVNKCDLDGTAELLAEINMVYGSSVPIFPVSATSRSGFAPLEEYFSDKHRGAFVGTTGVGKSSLLNVLCPEIDLKVGRVSDYKGMGRHTTTVSTLHALAGGGELVDTPGFRDFGLVDSTAEELAEYFPGFEVHRDVSCKYRNCRHRTEPGCAVLLLVEQGRIQKDRYSSYMQILKEVEGHQAAARCREWKN
jgi:ribosome biogenesis GTPase